MPKELNIIFVNKTKPDLSLIMMIIVIFIFVLKMIRIIIFVSFVKMAIHIRFLNM